MSYDLTSLFTTVAAASASIVAILGGFIASKLISINGDRKAVLIKLGEMEQREKTKDSELAQLKKEEEMNEALNFITDNLQALVDRKPMDEAYRNDKQQSISKEAMQPHWDRALEIHADYQKSRNEMNGSTDCNEKGIPTAFAVMYADDNFGYTVGCLIAIKLKSIEIGYPTFMFEKKPIFALSDLAKERKGVLEAELRDIAISKEQLEDEKKRLTKPEGMKTGLVVFALFSLLCIVFPLSLSPFSTDNACTAWLLKLLILVLFTAGLTGIIRYLVSLLRWKESKR